MSPVKLGDNWVDGGDGYFYHTKALNKGDVTDAFCLTGDP